MAAFTESGNKAEFTRIISSKLGVSEEALGAFARRAKEKFRHSSGHHNGIATIKEYLRKGDIAGAKAAITRRVAEKFNTSPERLGELVRGMKAKRSGQSESMAHLKGRVRGYFPGES